MGFLRIFLMSIILTTGFNALAMECEPMDTSSDDMITLISAEGKKFAIERSVAQRSGQIASLLIMPDQNRIAFREISAPTLAKMVALLTKLDQLLQRNEIADTLSQIYIPRAYQPAVNKEIEQLSNPEIAALFNAADFLDVPFIINALAAVIADRIYAKIPGDWDKFTFVQRSDLVSDALITWNIHIKQEYVLKHVASRKSDIMQEYSIADYIAARGNPRSNNNQIDLSGLKLTSLFGMALLENRNQIHILFLGSNHLGNLALDVQPAHEPFAHLANLQMLNLSGNKLTNLPEQIFAQVANLQGLYLSHNQLTNLPEQIFVHLANLQKLSLRNNQLNNLPEQIFAGLANLQILGLFKNQLNNLPEKIFAYLANLQRLYLSGNQLSEQNKQAIKMALPAQTEIYFN